MTYFRTAEKLAICCLMVAFFLLLITWFWDQNDSDVIKDVSTVTLLNSADPTITQAFKSPHLQRGVKRHVIDHHGATDNLWWQFAATTARKVTNSSCYVCTHLLHATQGSSLLQPWKVNITTVLSFFSACTAAPCNRSHILEASKPLKYFPCAINFSHHSVRFPYGFSNATNVSVAGSVMTHSVSSHMRSAPLCFVLPCAGSSFNLGNAVNCDNTVPASCALTDNRPSCADDPLKLWLRVFNLTKWGLRGGAFSSLQVYTPSPDGYPCPTNMDCGVHTSECPESQEEGNQDINGTRDSLGNISQGWTGRCVSSELITTLLNELEPGGGRQFVYASA
ncbi:uncharacterized protein LOC110367726 [Fundulus heteroclitus]|uniref:uncharacterized protein LOC110367726 n=1 Tax=Fundulus heteroclitus TaxID=8078 RepID=UPI00165ACFE5|nr:uncharacterized protein LOC110367726 [Fundulus heteroclitus]